MMLWRLLFHIMRLLLLIPLPGHGDAYSLTECNSDENFDIVQNQQPVLTCTGLRTKQNISWSIRNSSSDNEMKIGTCGDCKAGCSGCSPLVEGYTINRDSNDSTTLQFLNHSLVPSGSTIKCSNLKNRFNATCTLFVVPAYRFSECRAGAIMVAENKKSPIVCEGLLAAQNMYWTVTYGNGTVSTIAQCRHCQNNTNTCPKCTITDADFNVTREDNSSTLMIHNNVRQKDGATLTCSKKDNATHSDCKILVVSYRFSECRAGAIMVAENKKSPIVCEGLLAAQNMYWAVTYGNGTVSNIAQCSYCQNNTNTCPKCTITDADFNVTREDNSSTLMIHNNVRQKDGATLTCSKKDNVTHSDCKIIVVYLEEANITLHDNWTVTGSVTVSKVPASDNITCLWYNSVNNEMHHLASSAAASTPYNNSDTGKAYLNVSCHLNTTLSPYMVGSNDIFVKILPDGRPFLAATVTVDEPGSLILDGSTCLLSVMEGSNLTCTCKNKDDTQGYPSGRVLWTNNAGSAVLELPDIQQNQGVVHVCRSLWGPHDEVFDTLNYSVIVNPLDLNQERATGLPVAAVAGSVVGFVVIVAIAIFIAVILKRRKSKREATKDRHDSAPNDDEFEEHINEFYQSADDPDLPRRSPPNSPTPLSLANPSLDVQGAGSDGPENHVYAQVKKEKKEHHNKPGQTHDVKQHIKGGKIQKHADKGGAVYTECLSDTKDDNSVNNVYMNADESAPLPTDQDTQAAKKDSGNEDLHDPDLNTYHNTETTRHQGDYTNVQLELHDGEGVMKTAETDDEYRHLQLARPEQLDENPTYNHLAGV